MMKSNLITSGRTAARRVPAALLASLTFPGMGHMYCGRLSRGTVYATSLFLAALLAPLGLVLRPDNPSLHRAVFLVTLYAVIFILCQGDTAFTARSIGQYTRKRYNAWWAYALFGMLSFTLQAGAILAITSFYSTALIDTDAMDPTFRRGERVLLAMPPQRAWKAGDAVSCSGDGAYIFGRIVAVGGDRVSRTRGRLEVNGVPLSLGIFPERDLARRDIANQENVFYEVSGERKYSVIESLGKGAVREGDFAEKTVEKESVLIAFDNRPAHTGLVPVGTNSLRGRLEGVLWPAAWSRLMLLPHYPL